MKVAGQGVGERMKRVPFEVTPYTSFAEEKPTSTILLFAGATKLATSLIDESTTFTLLGLTKAAKRVPLLFGTIFVKLRPS
jgi:hypothetical protein